MNPSRTSATAFAKNDRIVAAATVQGMTAGHRYTVVDLSIRSLPFGTFVSYELQAEGDGEPFWVGNLHLLATRTNGA